MENQEKYNNLSKLVEKLRKSEDSEGILSPNSSSPLSHLQISMIFVPCLSVDKNLTRLGLSLIHI